MKKLYFFKIVDPITKSYVIPNFGGTKDLAWRNDDKIDCFFRSLEMLEIFLHMWKEKLEEKNYVVEIYELQKKDKTFTVNELLNKSD